MWLQAYYGLQGTLLTWFLTALGAATVFLVPRNLNKHVERIILDIAFGFAGGVMLAASFWSLLDPAIELAMESGLYGDYSFVPAAVGFFLGAVCIFLCDKVADSMGLGHETVLSEKSKFPPGKRVPSSSPSKNRPKKSAKSAMDRKSWKRMMLLVSAITIHNFPEGVAVGVAFGSATISSSRSFDISKAWAVAIGVGIQNIPEGLAVSLPMYRSGSSRTKAFFYGQLSGMVEPIGGVLGAVAVSLVSPLLPYALSFAAGAMVFVVVDDLLIEAHSSGNGKLCTWGLVVGFIVMMSLDVAFG